MALGLAAPANAEPAGDDSCPLTMAFWVQQSPKCHLLETTRSSGGRLRVSRPPRRTLPPRHLSRLDSERCQACNLVSAARRAGVAQCVHPRSRPPAGARDSPTSTPARRPTMGQQGTRREHGPQRRIRHLHDPQAGIDDGQLHRTQGADHVPASTRRRDPHRRPTGRRTGDRSKSDIAAAASAAFADPERFANEEIELAGDATTIPEIAAQISNATERSVVARTLTQDEVDAREVRRSGWKPICG